MKLAPGDEVLLNLQERHMPGFRPHTKLEPREQTFLFRWEGMGGMLCWSSALLYIHSEMPYLKGIVYCYDWFLPLLKAVMGPECRWSLKPHTTLDLLVKQGRAPKEVCGSFHSALSCGSHPIDYGFLSFANILPPPPDWNYYPEVKADLPHWFKLEPRSYVVLTPCATHEVRAWTPEVFKTLKEHILSKGLKVALVGTECFGDRGTPLNKDFDLRGCENYLNQTELLQAQAIMSRAYAVVGLDNGLLHLAATSEVPLVFGYTVASPEHREPRRRRGITVNFVPSEEELSCRFCQSRMRFTGHDFKECIYGDLKCVKEVLTPRKWCEAFDFLQEKVREAETA